MQMYNKAQAGGLSAQTPQPTDLGNIKGRLYALAEEVAKDGETLRVIADRVTGSVPEEPAPPRGGPTAVVNGAISEINEVIDGISHRISINRDTMRRLENLA